MYDLRNGIKPQPNTWVSKHFILKWLSFASVIEWIRKMNFGKFSYECGNNHSLGEINSFFFFFFAMNQAIQTFLHFSAFIKIKSFWNIILPNDDVSWSITPFYLLSKVVSPRHAHWIDFGLLDNRIDKAKSFENM